MLTESEKKETLENIEYIKQSILNNCLPKTKTGFRVLIFIMLFILTSASIYSLIYLTWGHFFQSLIFLGFGIIASFILRK